MPSQTTKPVLIDTVSDDIRVINQNANTKQKNIASVYALSNIFKGTPFDKTKYDDVAFYTGTDVDLDKVTVGCLRRISTAVLNGPPISDPSGYLHVVTCSGDLTWNSNKVISETPDAIRIRQIVYPDNTNDPTPYTRVGYAETISGTITWSPWNTLGGNLIRRLLLQNTNPALPNSMYESFGNFTLTLPNPNSYSLGTRIGLEQYQGVGSVVYSDLVQATAPDTDQNNAVVGAMIYLFEVVDATPANATSSTPVYAWRMDTLQNYDNSISSLQEQISEHRLIDQDNLASYSLSNGRYVIPQRGYVEYFFTPNTTLPITQANTNITRSGTNIASISHQGTTATLTRTGAFVKGTDLNGVIRAIAAVNAGDVVTFTCTQLTAAQAASASSPIKIVFSPDEHAMYLRDDELNDSWHDNSTLSNYGGFFTASKHLNAAKDTPASVKALMGLEAYVDSRDTYVIGLLTTHKTSDDHDNRYILKANITDVYHSSAPDAAKVLNQVGVSALASVIQSRGLLYGPILVSSATLDTMKTYGVYELASIANGGPATSGADITNYNNSTLIVIPYSSHATTSVGQGSNSTTTILQILVGKVVQQNLTYRTCVGGSWSPWVRVAKAKHTFSMGASAVSAATVQAALYWCEPIYVMAGGSVTLPAANLFPSGTKVQVEATTSTVTTIRTDDGAYTYSVGLTNDNRTLIPLETDGTNWYMVCVG